MRIFFTFLFIVSALTAHSQKDRKKELVGERFEGYSGQFFYFESDLDAEIHIKGAEQTYNAKEANLNLVTKAIEVKKGEKYVEISRRKFSKVIFNKNGHVISMIPAPLTEGFIFNLYETPNYKFFHEILPTIEDRVYNIPGKVYERSFVRNKHTYTLYVNDQPHTVELKKKGILKVLGGKASEIAKRTKNKLKNEWDVVALLAAMEQDS